MSDDARQQAYHKITGMLLHNACSRIAKENPDFHFLPQDASGQAVYRFSTSVSEQVFGKSASKDGPWKNGKSAMYEIMNEEGDLLVRFSVGSSFFADAWLEDYSSILVGNSSVDDERGILSIASWRMSVLYPDVDPNVAFESFVKEKLPEYEQKLLSWQALRSVRLEEGASYSVTSDRYERNPLARKKCIEAHGCRCAICGFDFKEAYGEEFEGIIQVHHIVPLGETKKNHVVDPEKDLIPVCPNCHVALHSKPGGVYLPEELKAKVKKGQ